MGVDLKKLFSSLAFTSFLLDRLSKALVETLIDGKVLTIIPGFFDIRCVENSGAAFSLLSTGNEILRFFFLLTLPMVVVGVVFYYGFFKSNSRLSTAGFALVMGGALGNLTDRFLKGKVLDFLDLHIGAYHYPTFNFADVAVFLGCLLLVAEHKCKGKGVA